MSTIGAVGRCCRSCGKERGPGRRCRRRQQPCLSSCSSCCYPDLASPAASVSPLAASWPMGPVAVDLAGQQSGRRTPGCTRLGRLACGLCTAAAKAPAPARRRVQRYCDRCARASQEGGGVPFCAASRSPPWNPAALSLQEIRSLDPGRGRRRRIPVLRFRNFDRQRDFNFSSTQVSTSLQCRKKGRAVSMWQDLPSF